MELEENVLFGEQKRYRLIRRLGHGGFSEVWLAEDEWVGLTVALKIYASGIGLDQDGVTQFSKEFNIVFNLNHPNLLRPTHYAVFQRRPYLIMPYCEHGPGSRLTGKIDERTAWKFLHDVASGLAYLHAQAPPVIHQDIKPDNVLLNSNDSFVITDFGISAKARTTLSAVVANAGTMAFMAPERFDPDYNPIFASDVWALGASLFELMTGKPPFGDNGGLAQRGGAEFAISGEWSPELKKMIHRCLKPKPWERPKAKEIYEETKQYIDEQKVTKQKQPEGKSQVIKRLALVVMVVLGLCAGFVAGRYVYQPNRKLQECMSIIEQGDAIFNENDLNTWRESLTKYQEAKEIIEHHSLPLPAMDHRIMGLKQKIDDVISFSIENSKRAFSAHSEMALAILQDALILDPDHEEANALYKQYINYFQQKE